MLQRLLLYLMSVERGCSEHAICSTALSKHCSGFYRMTITCCLMIKHLKCCHYSCCLLNKQEDSLKQRSHKDHSPYHTRLRQKMKWGGSGTLIDLNSLMNKTRCLHALYSRVLQPIPPPPPCLPPWWTATPQKHKGKQASRPPESSSGTLKQNALLKQTYERTSKFHSRKWNPLDKKQIHARTDNQRMKAW